MARPELTAALETARSTWPALTLAPERFLAHLEGLLEGEPAEALAGLHVGELYVALGCAEGDAAALAVFEQHFWPEVPAALARVRMNPELRQDLMQDLRLQLLVRVGDAPGKIASYRGSGGLNGWLRAVALRAAYKAAHRDERHLLLDDDALTALAGVDRDPALAHLKDLYRKEFKEAFEAAMAALTTRDRGLLRRHYLDGLTVDEIGPMYQVHRATAARWVAAARELLAEGTLARLRERLRVSESELESILRLAQSQIEVSLDRLLRAS